MGSYPLLSRSRKGLQVYGSLSSPAVFNPFFPLRAVTYTLATNTTWNHFWLRKTVDQIPTPRAPARPFHASSVQSVKENGECPSIISSWMKSASCGLHTLPRRHACSLHSGNCMWVSRRLLDTNSLIFFCWVPVGMLAGLGFILGCVSLWTIKGPRYQTGPLISQLGQVPKGFT